MAQCLEWGVLTQRGRVRPPLESELVLIEFSAGYGGTPHTKYEAGFDTSSTDGRGTATPPPTRNRLEEIKAHKSVEMHALAQSAAVRKNGFQPPRDIHTNAQIHAFAPALA